MINHAKLKMTIISGIAYQFVFLRINNLCSIYLFSDKSHVNLNDEQRVAVMNIVQAKNQPKPYVLFGPPGNFDSISDSIQI